MDANVLGYIKKEKIQNFFKRKNFESYSIVNEKNRVHTICVEPPSSDLYGPVC